MKNRTFALASSAAIALIALAGCVPAMPGMNRDDAPPAQSNSSFNQSDVEFAQLMIVHHEQAVEMSDLVLDKDGVDATVRDLATAITAAQGPEIALMNGWLNAWGQPSGADVDHGGMDHGGMMTDGDLADLEAASGSEASRLFLEQMIVHHEGAITMAEEQLRDGQDADAVALATRIVADQTEEIELMRELLASL